jgi:hypothetical protein
MAKLFETCIALDRLFITPEGDAVDTDTGEIMDKAYLDELKADKESITKWLAQEVLNIDSDIVAYKVQKEVFAEKQKRAEHRKESLKNYLAFCLNGDAFEADDKSVKISWRKSESVNILDEGEIPKEYIKVKTEYSPDKTMIKKALKDGQKVAGCTLESKNNIQIK